MRKLFLEYTFFNRTSSTIDPSTLAEEVHGFKNIAIVFRMKGWSSGEA